MSVTQVSFTRLTFPIFIQMALLLVIFFTDTLFLSTISDEAVAGVGSSLPLLIMGIALLHAYSDPGISILGQQIALGDKAKVSATFIVMLAICAVIGIALTILFLIISQPFGGWIGLDAASHEASYQYLSTLSFIFIFDILFINFNSMIFANGQTKVAMYAAFASAITNILLNWALYLGLIPDWQLGVREVAITTLIAQLPPILIMGYGIFKLIGFRFNFHLINRENLNWARKRILSISIPATIEPISYNASQLVIYSMLAGVVMSSVAAYTYGKNIFILFSYAAALAVGIGTQVVIAHHQGKNEYDMANRRMTRSLIKFLPIIVIVGIIINLLGVPILSLFTDDMELIAIGKDILNFMLVIETLKAGNFIIFPTLKGSGDVNIPIIFGVIANWLFGVGLGYYLAFFLKMGIYGIMIGVVADEALRFLINTYRWYKGYWLKNYSLEKTRN